MSTWINALQSTGNRLLAAAANVVLVKDNSQTIGVPGCLVEMTGATGSLNVTDPYAAVKATLGEWFVEFDAIDAINMNKTPAVPTHKASINAYMVESVKPADPGFTSIRFYTGREQVVAGEAAAVQETLTAAKPAATATE